MIEIINDTKLYWNQYFDVTDLPGTIKDERKRTCNITSVAMILGKHPDRVLNGMFDKYGVNDKFMWERHLINYLIDNGFECTEITKHAYPEARKITDDELINMMNNIKDGRIIFYHKKGHYQLMVGYRIREDAKLPEYIFNDPAGDRNKMLWRRKQNSGHLVTYSHKKIKREKIYGSCYSVRI